MVFSLIILVLLGAVAFFHYIQGLFSAALSAILAVLAAVVAVSYTEPLVLAFFTGGQFIDYAFAVVLISLFALIYIVLRILFDKLIPGNVRLPVLVDKIGAGVMGVVAGIFATGVFALAAESMPFGPAFGMHSLYPIKPDRGTVAITVEGQSRMQDAAVGDELEVATLEETDQRGGTWIPVADILLATVAHLSDGGSLAGSQSLPHIHPDLLQKLYGQRLGQQVGDKRTATADQISVVDVFAPPADAKLRQHSSEIKAIRTVPPERVATSSKRFLVVRVKVDPNATGAGDLFRFSTGAVNLTAGAADEPTTYFPVGTLDNGNLLFVSHPNDPLFLKPSAGDMIDFVFEIEPSTVLARGAGEGPPKIREGTFIEIKRFARIDLSGKTAAPAIPPSDQVKVLRKKAVITELNAPPEPAPK